MSPFWLGSPQTTLVGRCWSCNSWYWIEAVCFKCSHCISIWHSWDNLTAVHTLAIYWWREGLEVVSLVQQTTNTINDREKNSEKKFKSVELFWISLSPSDYRPIFTKTDWRDSWKHMPQWVMYLQKSNTFIKWDLYFSYCGPKIKMVPSSGVLHFVSSKDNWSLPLSLCIHLIHVTHLMMGDQARFHIVHVQVGRLMNTTKSTRTSHVGP